MYVWIRGVTGHLSLNCRSVIRINSPYACRGAFVIICTMELWLTVEDFPNYEVSDRGGVRNKKKGNTLIPHIRRGYPYVKLYRPSTRKNQAVHRLVAIAFLGAIPKGYNVDHINRVRSDNRVQNLRIVTPKENSNNRIDCVGLVDHVIELYKDGISADDIRASLEPIYGKV